MLSTIEQTGTRLLLSQRYAPFFRRVSPRLYVRTMSDHVAKREPEMALLPLFCSKSMTSVDIGVLWGAFSYRMARLSHTCYAFEPNPEQIPFLRCSVASNVKLIQEALSDHEEMTLLRLPYDVPGHATIEPANDLQGRAFKEYEIKCSTLDSHNLREISFIKIDAEGHEFRILQGMIKTLEREMPVLLIEIEQRHHPQSFDSVLGWLAKRDYRAFVFQQGALHSVTRQEENIPLKNRRSSNFLFFHQQEVNRIAAQFESE